MVMGFTILVGGYLLLKSPSRTNGGHNKQNKTDKHEKCAQFPHTGVVFVFFPPYVVCHKSKEEYETCNCPPTDMGEIRQDDESAKDDVFTGEFPEVEVHARILSRFRR